MQDNQIGQKFMGLAPADMDRLLHLINTKMFVEIKNLICQLGLRLLLTCIKREIVRIFKYIFLPV
jgi:hypothetical protein